MKVLTALLLTGAIFALPGCANSYKPGVYQSGQVQVAMKVKLATVTEVHEVEIQNPTTGAGAAAGSATGAIVGTAASSYRHTGGGIAAGIAGAVIGGVAGNAIEKASNTKTGVEIYYQLDGTSETMALVQEQDDNPIQKGDRIRIMEGSFATRAVKLPKS